MTVRVRLFAILRDRAGVSEFQLELADGAEVSRAQEMIVQRLPALRDYVGRCRHAVNHSYVRADALLRDGDELALIPPVSGG